MEAIWCGCGRPAATIEARRGAKPHLEFVCILADSAYKRMVSGNKAESALLHFVNPLFGQILGRVARELPHKAKGRTHDGFPACLDAHLARKFVREADIILLQQARGVRRRVGGHDLRKGLACARPNKRL